MPIDEVDCDQLTVSLDRAQVVAAGIEVDDERSGAIREPKTDSHRSRHRLREHLWNRQRQLVSQVAHELGATCSQVDTPGAGAAVCAIAHTAAAINAALTMLRTQRDSGS
jgi:hypothetical protein